MHVQSWLERAAAARPGHPALDTAAGTLPYARLYDRARAAAACLPAGARVGLALPAGEEFAVALHACWLAGAVAVPLDARLGEEERAVRAADCALVLDREPAGDPVPAGAVTHDLAATAVRLYTSGSTGPGTPVDLTFGNLLWSALGSGVALGHPAGERWLCALPLAHVGGLSILARSVIAATTALVHERFETEAVLRALREQGVTLVSLVPTTLARLLDAGLERPPALRAALLGGAPVPPAVLARARGAGVPVVTTYGLTEACSQVTTGGAPLFCTRVRIDDASGEILVAGPTVAPGALSPDGWLHTGDLGALDAEGALTVRGRAAETIVTGGENVAPTEVEAVLAAHPAIAEAAVHGRPDPEWGEAVVAGVVLRPGAELDAEAVRAFCRARLAGFKVPKEIRAVDALPRTASGKLHRAAL